MRLRAMAKINLGLDVLRKREDGYHEVRMIMQTIQMYDLLDIRKKSEPGIELSTNLPYVPSDERNLVYKAAKLLMDELFGADNFVNEITWYYYNKMAPKSACFPRTTDKILERVAVQMRQLLLSE